MKTLLDSTKDAVETMNFERAIAELERLLEQMERNSLSLDDSLAAYQRGSSLVKHCQLQLARVEQQVMLLDDGNGQPTLLSDNLQSGEKANQAHLQKLTDLQSVSRPLLADDDQLLEIKNSDEKKPDAKTKEVKKRV